MKKILAVTLSFLCVANLFLGAGLVSAEETGGAQGFVAVGGQALSSLEEGFAKLAPEYMIPSLYSVTKKITTRVVVDENGKSQNAPNSWTKNGITYAVMNLTVKDLATKKEVFNENTIAITKYDSKESGIYVIKISELDYKTDMPAEIAELYSGTKLSLQAIYDGAFKDTDLDLVDYSNSEIAYIGEAAFSGCTYLGSVDLPASLKFIGKNAFYKTGIREAKINSAIKFIPAGLFQASAVLENVTFAEEFKDEVKIIGQYAFASCVKLKDIYFSSSLETVGYRAFYECKSFKSVDLSGTSMKDFDSTIRDVVYKSTSSSTTYGSGFGESTFYGCSELEKVLLPKTISKLPPNTFKGCSLLSKINISESNIKTIGSYAFDACTSLTEVILPTLCNSIESYAFSGTGIKYMDISQISDTEKLGGYIFNNCASFEEVTINPEINMIPKNLFQNAKALKKVSLPDGNTELKNIQLLSDYSFSNCVALENLNMPNLEIAGKYSFDGCTALVSIADNKNKIPENLTFFGDYCFRKCTNFNPNLSESTIESLGKYSFSYSGIKSLKIKKQDRILIIGAGAFSGSALQSVYLPEGLDLYNTEKSIFSSCKDLSTVVFYGVRFPESTFLSCKALKSIVAPNVTDIGTNAFYSCTGLANIITKKDSALYNYAVEKNINTAERFYGDCNSDFSVDNLDIVAMCQHLVKVKELEGEDLLNSDLTGDDIFDVADVAILKQYLMGDKVKLGK
jgi:hypothetical protein